MIDFDELIENYFKKEFRQKKIGNYYPSEIGGCIRKTWFSYTIPKELDKDVLKIFEAGNNVHELITKILKSDKNPNIDLIENEMPFEIKEQEFRIGGRIDNLVFVKDKNKKVLIEVKSCKFLPFEPKDPHVDQLQLYMHATGIQDGIVLYIQKDNLQTRPFSLIYDEKKALETIKRFHALHLCLKENEMPPAEAKLVKGKNWMCNYCEYKKECDNYPTE